MGMPYRLRYSDILESCKNVHLFVIGPFSWKNASQVKLAGEQLACDNICVPVVMGKGTEREGLRVLLLKMRWFTAAAAAFLEGANERIDSWDVSCAPFATTDSESAVIKSESESLPPSSRAVSLLIMNEVAAALLLLYRTQYHINTAVFGLLHHY